MTDAVLSFALLGVTAIEGETMLPEPIDDVAVNSGDNGGAVGRLARSSGPVESCGRPELGCAAIGDLARGSSAEKMALSGCPVWTCFTHFEDSLVTANCWHASKSAAHCSLLCRVLKLTMSVSFFMMRMESTLPAEAASVSA